MKRTIHGAFVATPRRVADGDALLIPPPPPWRSRLPRPPITRIRVSIRELLCGQRSLLFIGLMLARLLWVVIQSIRNVRDLRYALVGGGIFVMAVLIASRHTRVRAPAIGALCGLVWAYALTDQASVGSPTLEAWPAIVEVSAVAMLLEVAYTHLDPRLHRVARPPGGMTVDGFMMVALGIQVAELLMCVAPIVFIGAMALANEPTTTHLPWDLVPFAFSLPPVVGVGVYALYVLRRQRELIDAARAV
jgi:hypothetical protein